MVLKSVNIESQPVDPKELKGDPHHLAPLLDQFLRFAKPERILDPTAGSGITAKIAQAHNIPCDVYDLHDPANSVDLFTIEEGGYDLIIYHPDMWGGRDGATHPRDLGADVTWDAYVDNNAEAIQHLSGLLTENGHLVAICPITRRKGGARSLARDLSCLIGAPREPTVIHPHPSCRSRGSMFGKRFIPVAHDEVLVWRKSELDGATFDAFPGADDAGTAEE